MLMALRALVNKVDGIPERTLLWVNLGLACLIGLAHGGALAITYAKPSADAETIRQLASISLPLAAVVLLTSVTALVQTRFRQLALGLHGLVLAAGAVVTVLWAISILFAGIPDGKLVWSVGMMSAFVVYALFVASRYSVPKRFRDRLVAFYAPLLALVVAIPIDVAVFVKTLSALTKGFG
jgi:hypothetical protein